VIYFGFALNAKPKIYLIEKDAQIVMLGRVVKDQNILGLLPMPIKTEEQGSKKSI